MSKRLIKSFERTLYDENGLKRTETTEKELVLKTNEDKFYMVFIDFVKWMYNITSVNSLKLLPKLIEKAEFNTGIVSLSAGTRDVLTRELGLSPATFTRALNDLIANEAIFKCYQDYTDEETGEVFQKEIRGEYLINPEMFWKGDLKKRKELKVTFQSIPE